ncbi:unnamed protein product [Onchocerca ochengi]|uniref:Apple domain-containing protein n=1 Tax=Onchocerca ochengi TaxID=42157 RepID=A0A182ELR8_ONCOC|nr:unnamed protein product [Onchocerca ochengi]
MRTPEECLVFCALSSSRCRSTVYDIFQHICYYFLDDGQQHKQIARGMVYFRVTEKKCLDQSLNNSNPALANSEFAIPITSAPSSTPEYDIRRNFNELQQPAVVYANSLIHIPPGGRAITPTPYFAYFGNQQKLRKSEKFDESNLTVLTSTTIKSDNITISTNNTITVTSPTTSPISSSTFSTTIAEKEDEIYDDPIQILPDSEFSSSTFPMLSSWPRKDSIRSTVRRSEALKQPNHQIHKISNDASFFVGNIANLPQFNKNFGNDRQKNGADLNKPLKTIPQDIRRSPFKTSLMDIEKLDKDRNEMLTSINTENSIMDKMMPIPTIKSISMTLSKQNNEMKKFSSSVILQTAICESNELEVWLVVENAVLQIDKLQMKMSAGSHKSCRTKCNLITKSGRECSSYIYDDVKRHCVIHTNYDVAVISLDLLPSPETDFTIRTAIKFCFPGLNFILSIIIFEK